MKKTAFLLYPQFSEYEMSVALSILMQGGKPVMTIGVTKEPIKGESGLSVLPDATIHEIVASEIDSLLLSGCMDIGEIIDDSRYTDFIKRITTDETIIASISSSPTLLAKAGILKDKTYTVGLPEEAIKHLDFFQYEHYSNELLVQDGNIITARGRGFIAFGIAFGKALRLQFDENWYMA